jgi:putative PIG3 family NAD(P)H quinone oxidoreductase
MYLVSTAAPGQYRSTSESETAKPMRAILVEKEGDPEHLTLGEHPDPTPAPDELLVDVHATALNRADTMQRRGNYPVPEGASAILGLEMAGVVAEAGAECAGWAAGDRVFGLLAGGGYAERTTIHHEEAMPIPEALSFEEAAAVPEVFLTAYQALHWLGELQRGERALVHAGASGVGTAAIQLAVEAGAEVLVTASAPKHDLCRELGARAAIDYRSEDFAARVEELTGGAGVDVILDFIGAPYFQKNIQSLRTDGRVIQLATLGGATVEEVSLRALMAKRVHLKATTLRSRAQGYKIRLSQEFAAYALPLFEEGTLRPVTDRVYDWDDAAEAHRRMEANENAGKLVLRVGGGM